MICIKTSSAYVSRILDKEIDTSAKGWALKKKCIEVKLSGVRSGMFTLRLSKNKKAKIYFFTDSSNSDVDSSIVIDDVNIIYQSSIKAWLITNKDHLIICAIGITIGSIVIPFLHKMVPIVISNTLSVLH